MVTYCACVTSLWWRTRMEMKFGGTLTQKPWGHSYVGLLYGGGCGEEMGLATCLCTSSRVLTIVGGPPLLQFCRPHHLPRARVVRGASSPSSPLTVKSLSASQIKCCRCCAERTARGSCGGDTLCELPPGLPQAHEVSWACKWTGRCIGSSQ